MKRALGFAIVVSVMIAGVAIADMEDGRTPVHPYVQAPDGGMIRTQADELGRAYVRLVSADGGVPEVRGTVAVTSPDGGIPEVSLGDLGTSAQPAEVVIGANSPGASLEDPLFCSSVQTALAPGYVAIVDALGNQIGIAAAPLASEPIVDGSAVSAAHPLPAEIVADGAAVGAANPLPTTPTDALHPAELTVSTSCLFLALPSASALTPTAGQRYRLMARNDYVCIKAGSAPASCEGVPMFAPDAPEAVAFAAINAAAPDLYFFTPGTSAGIELCPLVEQ